MIGMFLVGAALGSVLGACAMWLYLMNTVMGRPVQWHVMVLSSVLTLALIGAALSTHQ